MNQDSCLGDKAHDEKEVALVDKFVHNYASREVHNYASREVQNNRRGTSRRNLGEDRRTAK